MIWRRFANVPVMGDHTLIPGIVHRIGRRHTMRKDLCSDCVFNARCDGGWNCLFTGSGITSIDQYYKTLSCDDYVNGDPLPVDVTPERLHEIYLQLFPERRDNGGYPVNEPEYQKRRYIYRVMFYVILSERYSYCIDIGAVKKSQAIATVKAMWIIEGRTAHMLAIKAQRVNTVEFLKFTPLIPENPIGVIIPADKEQADQIDRPTFTDKEEA